MFFHPSIRRLGRVLAFLMALCLLFTTVISQDALAAPPLKTFHQNPKWQKSNKGLGGTRMHVIFGPKAALGIHSGRASNGTQLKQAFNKYLKAGGAKGDFIRGHLLNADLGGPNKNFNLTPMTRGTNKWHSKFENEVKVNLHKLKNHVINNPADANMGIEYEVIADHSKLDSMKVFAEIEVNAYRGRMISGKWVRDSGPNGTIF